jgi:LacI family transcriptional regulator
MSKPGVVSIAKSCGVSPSTVCRALNGKPGINKDTRDAILAACKRFRYSKNIAACNPSYSTPA